MSARPGRRSRDRNHASKRRREGEVHDHDVRWFGREPGQPDARVDGELREAGELVASQGLADPSQAKTVRFQNGVPVPTDGPFAEVKESLAGYWIVDVSEDRAIEIASQVVAFIEHPMEVRRIMDEPPAP